ncbi:MAG: cyclopropane-fatty-acyl-phospholipid synthase family protein [Acidimicrobiia bacterium]|nr:cyclopropane-fatty-acyl-phospholipid synthase family protein [Acidimicrobiia bacterium]
MRAAQFLEDLFGGALPVPVRCYDGSEAGPRESRGRLVLHSPDVFRHFLYAPGELGLARAFVTGELTVEGDIDAVAASFSSFTGLRPRPRHLVAAARLIGARRLRPLPPPELEIRLRGRRHTRRRDSAAISHHYDASNRFYELLLGPSMTYSCAIFSRATDTLETAQSTKVDLICRKLGLGPDQRLLDVGCGWGSLVIHAARRYGVAAVGVTVSKEQADYARDRVRAAGLEDQVEIRLQDYRDVEDAPFDAISSVGMFEHVGEARTAEYLGHLRDLLGPGGRLLNHAISRPRPGRARIDKRGFMNRYVFPDGELLEVGTVVSAAQRHGLEVRHVESLREHYAQTLRAWGHNLAVNWDAAVSEVGEARARVWRLYLAASAVNFETNGVSVHQVLTVRPTVQGRSGMPLRPDWEVAPAASELDLAR